MCLILSYNPETRVANTDIICYKLVVKKANGIYQTVVNYRLLFKTRIWR